MKYLLLAFVILPSLQLAAKQDAKSIADIRAKAQQGDTLAMDKLGLYYLHGDGVPKDYVEGLKLIRMAAEQGNIVAIQNLGAFYHNGSYGLPKDSVESVKWYRQAADRGSRTAPMTLGKMYAAGDGVPKDEIEALAWLILAIGVEGASAQRRMLEDHVGPEGNRAAKKRSKEILAEIDARKTAANP